MPSEPNAQQTDGGAKDRQRCAYVDSKLRVCGVYSNPERGDHSAAYGHRLTMPERGYEVHDTCKCGDWRDQHPNDGPCELNGLGHGLPRGEAGNICKKFKKARPELRIIHTKEAAMPDQTSAPIPPASPERPLTIRYTNHRGETALRDIIPQRLWFGVSRWHPEPQWLLDAHDVDKDSARTFALSGIGQPVSPEREAEIDALRERERRLWEYAAHKGNCASTIAEGMTCTCGLAELLAAKEDS